MQTMPLKLWTCALSYLLCLLAVAPIKAAEQAPAAVFRATKRSMSAVFEEENGKRVCSAAAPGGAMAKPDEAVGQRGGGQATTPVSTTTTTTSRPHGVRKLVTDLFDFASRGKKARPAAAPVQVAEPNRTALGQRKAGLKTVKVARFHVPGDVAAAAPDDGIIAKKARQEDRQEDNDGQAATPTTTSSASTPTAAPDAQQLEEIASLRKQVETLSDMFRSVCLASVGKANSDAQQSGELALTQRVLQGAIANAEQARLEHDKQTAEYEQKNAALEAGCQGAASVALKANAKAKKAESELQIMKKALSKMSGPAKQELEEKIAQEKRWRREKRLHDEEQQRRREEMTRSYSDY